MENQTRSFVLSLLLCSCFTASSHAKVLDFEFLNVPQPGPHHFGNLYIEDGFMVINAGAGTLAYYGRDHADYAGSTGLFATLPNNSLTLAALNGRLITPKSIDLAPKTLNLGPVSVTFTGFKKDGDTVSTSFAIGATDTFTTFTFGDDFKHITHLQWSQGGVGHQFDNIEVRNSPEPSSAALILLIGLVGIPLATGRWMRHAQAEDRAQA
ncbi:MAG: hypothetical protein AAFX76_01240 [Planctomycetota bacterium]